MHPAEWAARVELASCYRLFDMLGWTELIYNHITLRVPAEASGGDKHFLINPFGLHYSEVKASNLVKIDLAGRIIGHSDWPINPAGLPPHSAIHGAIERAHCVMHTHTTTGMAVACSQEGLQQSNFYSSMMHGMVAYHDFEGITVHDDEGPRLVKNIGDRQAVILRNHGLLAWGASVPEAFVVLWTLQRACDVQVATAALGAPRIIPDAIAARSVQDALQYDATKYGGPGRNVYDAMVRLLERTDDSYKT